MDGWMAVGSNVATAFNGGGGSDGGGGCCRLVGLSQDANHHHMHWSTKRRSGGSCELKKVVELKRATAEDPGWLS